MSTKEPAIAYTLQLTAAEAAALTLILWGNTCFDYDPVSADLRRIGAALRACDEALQKAQFKLFEAGNYHHVTRKTEGL